MLFSAHKHLWPVVLLAGLLAGGPAPAAATSGVEDGAGFFSADAVQKARDGIKEIKDQFNKDLLIQTFKTIPAERKEGQNLQGEARQQFYKKWVDDRIKETNLHGVYVLITRSPGRVEVGVSEDTLKRGFPVADRDRLSKLLLAKFQAKEYDAGLLDGVRLVHDTLAKNLPARLPSPVVNAVKDYGGFFTPEAVQKADAELKEINSRTKKNIIFETFKKAPAADVQRIEDMTARQRDNYFAGWMKSRVQGIRFDVYVLITRDPGHLQIALGPDVEQKVFTAKDRDQLKNILLAKFKDKEYDQGLSAAIDDIRKTLDAHLGSATPSPRPMPTARATNRTSATAPTTAPAGTTARGPATAAETKKMAPATHADTQKAGVAAIGGGGDNQQTSGWGGFKPIWILWIVLGLLGLWILYGIIRGLTHRRQTGPAGGYPPPGYGPGAGQPTGMVPTQYGGAPGQQVGPHYAGGQPPPGYAAGYGPGQPPAGYGYGPGAPYGGGGGGRTGGFLTGMLGGMFGAAAGNWVYDSFLRSPHSQPSGGFGPQAYGGEPHQHVNPPPTADPSAGAAAGAGAGGFSSTGGDFDASSGQPVETSGGDFDAGDNQPDTSGGDFGTDATPAEGGADGDFGNGADTGSGGDFGGDADSGSDGGFGGDDTSGGDFGGDSGGGDSGGDFGGGGDAGGGDF